MTTVKEAAALHFVERVTQHWPGCFGGTCLIRELGDKALGEELCVPCHARMVLGLPQTRTLLVKSERSGG